MVIPSKYCNDRWPVYLDTVGSPKLSPWELIPYNIKHTYSIVVHMLKQRHTERSQYTVFMIRSLVTKFSNRTTPLFII